MRYISCHQEYKTRLLHTENRIHPHKGILHRRHLHSSHIRYIAIHQESIDPSLRSGNHQCSSAHRSSLHSCQIHYISMTQAHRRQCCCTQIVPADRRRLLAARRSGRDSQTSSHRGNRRHRCKSGPLLLQDLRRESDTDLPCHIQHLYMIESEMFKTNIRVRYHVVAMVTVLMVWMK